MFSRPYWGRLFPIALFTAVFSISTPSSLLCEDLKVFPGQYVVQLIESEGASTSALSASLGTMGVSEVRRLGFGSFRVQKGVILQGKAKAVSYNPLDSFCKDLIASNSDVQSCTPDFEIRANIASGDPQNGQLWGLNATQGIDAPRAWNVSTGSKSTVVAIIDTGVDYNHSDLAANIWTNSGEIAGNGVDDDNNGYIDDLHGMNAINGSGNPMDDNGHGTHVAGTIGAVGNNGIGISGINWNVSIIGLKFLSASGSGSLSGAVECINYMVALKNRGVNIRVSNNSWGGGGYSDSLYTAIRRASDAGIIFAAAAGNEANDNDASPSYPATYDSPNVVSVAAIDQGQNIANFSNFGAQTVDISAPGVSIYSTKPGGSYQTMSGTSMATPHVTGALALLISSHPSLTMEQAITRLYESGRTLNSLSGLVRTGRTLDVARMVHNETSPVVAPTPGPSCTYSMSDIAYDPDLSADSASIALQADDTPLQRVDLPFEFPFDGGATSYVTVSPNGVLYVGNDGVTGDYLNRSYAPVNSIAALNTDLYASVDPEGVRYSLSADHATIFWYARHYASRTSGYVEVRVTLYADGSVKDFVKFSDSALESTVQVRSTIGITGGSILSASTYASNNGNIRSGIGVLFTPSCSNPSRGNSSISNIVIEGPKGKKRLEPGARFGVQLEGTGTGTESLRVKLNGRECNDSASVSFDNGARMKGKLPGETPSSFKSLVIAAGNVSGSVSIKRSGIRHSRVTKKVSRASLCRKIVRSLRQR